MNLSTAEWVALKSLSKRRNAAVTGGRKNLFQGLIAINNLAIAAQILSSLLLEPRSFTLNLIYRFSQA